MALNKSKMQENGRGVVVVHRALLRQLAQVGQAQPLLQVLCVVETVGREHPARELSSVEAVEVGQAGHAVLEVTVAEGPREVELPVDAVLLALLQHYSPAVDDLHELLLVAQVVGRGQLGRFPLRIHPEQLAVAEVGHHQRLFDLQQHQGSGSLFVLFYNFSLQLREHYHHSSLTLQQRLLRLGEDAGVRGQSAEQLGLQEVGRLRIAVAVDNGEEAEVGQREVGALGRGRVTRSRLSFLRPWLVNEVKFYSWRRVPLSSLVLFGDLRAAKEG